MSRSALKWPASVCHNKSVWVCASSQNKCGPQWAMTLQLLWSPVCFLALIPLAALEEETVVSNGCGEVWPLILACVVPCLCRIVDSIQECCHCQESAVCITSVDLINTLLTSADLIVQGQGLTENKVAEMLAWYKDSEGQLSQIHSLTGSFIYFR